LARVVYSLLCPLVPKVLDSQGDGSNEAVTVLAEHRAEGPHTHGIVQVRRLDLAEAAETREAVELINTVSRSTAFRRVQQLAELALARIAPITARDQPAQHEIDACVAAIAALVRARETFEKSASELSNSSATASIDELSSHPAWNALNALAADPLSFKRDRGGRVGTLDAANQFVELGVSVASAVAACQRVFIAILRARADDVLAAGKRLRLLQAEAPEGRPTLIASPEYRPDGTAMSLTPENLPMEQISEALRIARFAVEHGDADDMPGPKKPDQDTMPEPAISEAEAHESNDTAAETQGSPAGSPAPEGAAASEPQPPTDPPVDLQGLIRLARELNDDLERAWSGALERAVHQDGVQRQIAAVRGAIVAVQRLYANDQKPMDEWPPGAEQMVQFERDPSASADLMPTAQLLALVAVLEGLNPVAQASRVEVSWKSGEGEKLSKYWEAGAFSVLRARLELLGDLLRSPGESGRANQMDTFRHLRSAQMTWRKGDPEACLAHAAAGLATHLKTPVEELAPVLAADPVLVQAGLADQACAALRVLQRVLRGEAVLALATITAPALADALLVLSQPLPGGERLSAQDLHDLIAREVPFESLRDVGTP
jgi:hypothetical protein